MRATGLKSGAVVLMARIVNAAGVAIRPSSVVAIEYSICETDRYRPRSLNIVAGDFALPLNVGDVMFDTLQTGRAWTVDVSGYNFRHEFDAVQNCGFFNRNGRYEIRYIFTPTDGASSIIRFQLRCLKL